MGYRTLRQCLEDLRRIGQLVEIDEEVDPHLEVAEIQRRVYAAGGPAVLYKRVKGCRFPLVSNLFGTLDRARFLFRDTLDAVQRLIELKIDPGEFLKRPWRYRRVPLIAWCMRPRRVRSGPVLKNQIRIDELPQVHHWPEDGGAYITLPQVYTEDPARPGFAHSNLGMYRVQISGGRYQPNREVGLHYQIHRGIGVHHATAIERGEPLRVNIFVGGPPAMTLAAVMPLPEGMPELFFAGALAGHRIPMICRAGELPISAQADFCITGTIDPERLLPEGPFGDHFGYYSLAHDFPVLRVEKVFHRDDAIWPFTVVGRPPQEDSTFGALVHEISGPAIPAVVPGVRAIHAVDAAGVHPLLLAIASERYTPYAPRRKPQEILRCANALLGQGQLSLTKYLLIVAHEDDPQLDVHNVERFFRHVLTRVDWQTDLHFQTCTTIDTLDYSGTGLNEGSKLIVAAAGPVRRAHLPAELPPDLRFPDGFDDPRVALPGVLVVQAPAYAAGPHQPDGVPQQFCSAFSATAPINQFPLVVLVDDSRFAAARLENFLWVTFTRSNPATDVHGIEAFVQDKHWGCRGSLVIDARQKPHHAPPLVEDPQVAKRVDQLAAPGGPLHGIV
ncbi:MAG: UbiD family decarboxylase [Planctomycetes bacterium]|nr:UbiD family decarboxylase [Planctomycetota bacterium]